MADHDAERAASVGLVRLLATFAGLAVLLLGVLAIAPARSHFSEWRTAQQRYNHLAVRAGLPPIDVHIRQIIRPTLGVVDRCGSCHLAAAGLAAPVGDPLFRAHPPMPHDPTAFGCTLCHEGQGRATDARAAHGHVPEWDEPLLPRAHVEAGCGICHSHVVVANAEFVARGRVLFDGHGCRSCHTLDGRGGSGKVDLSRAGLAEDRRGWADRHIEAAAASPDPRWVSNSLPEEAAALAALDAYVSTFIGAPRLMAGKALVHERGCRGCHRIGGVGGDDGPDLSDIGARRATDLDFSHVRGAHTVENWLGDVLAEPSRVDPHSRMSEFGLDRAQIDVLVTYLLSLRQREIPPMYWPRDRLRGMGLGERDFATDGASLFASFCSACHGPHGEGRVLRGAPNVRTPAIGGPVFLALADDAFLRRTVRDGRPDQRMPAWGASDGGLRASEIDAVVEYLRTLAPVPPSVAEVMTRDADLAAGRVAFAASCASCHGARGEGSAIGPPLAAVDNPVSHVEQRVYSTLVAGVEGTAMGAFRALDAGTLRSLVAAVLALEPVDASRADWKPHHGDGARGRGLFERNCVRCHGDQASEPRAPSIRSAAFLVTATDGFLTASIVRRHGRARLVDGRPADVADLVAYLRVRGR